MRVIERSRRPVEERAPPAGARPHPWASPVSGGPTVFLEAGLAELLERDAARAAKRSEEALSLLIGDRFVDPTTGEAYPVAKTRVTGPLESSAARVRFDAGGFQAVARALEAVPFDYLVVGWFHSHVGLGCRPSTVDLETHRRYFAAPHQFAFIADTVEEEAAAYTFAEGALRPRPLAVFDPPADRL